MRCREIFRKKLLRYGVIAFGCLYALVCVLGCVSQRSVVWPMSMEEEVDRPVPPGARLTWATTEEGDLVEGWLFLGEGVSVERPGPALVFFHGNNELIDHCLEFAEVYPKWGLSVMLVEYRGYGRSGGKPSREGVRSDMIQFYNWLVDQPEVDADRIVFQGRSLGGAVAADLAGEVAPAALILVSTFTSMEVMFWRFGIPGFMASDKYRTESLMETFSFPVLVIHGNRDNIVPVGHGRELGSLGADTQYIEYDANHDLPTDWDRFQTDIQRFLREKGILGGP